MGEWQSPAGPLTFRDTAESDAYTVTRWRNSESARAAFFSREVTTPDTHRAFVRGRPLHDLVWIVEDDGTPIGMTSLTVDVAQHTAEYGRTFVDDAQRGRGVGMAIEWAVLWMAFEVLRLRSLWLEIRTSNTAMLALHERLGWQTEPVTFAGATTAHADAVVMTYTAARWTAERDRLLAIVQDRVR